MRELDAVIRCRVTKEFRDRLYTICESQAVSPSMLMRLLLTQWLDEVEYNTDHGKRRDK